MKYSNLTGIPENSKILKYGLWFLCLIATAVIISSSIFIIQNSTAEEIKVYMWPILTIILFSISVYIYKHIKLQSESSSSTSKIIRKTLGFIQSFIIFLGLIGYIASNSLTGYRGTGLFYSVSCRAFSYFNPHLIVTAFLTLILILNLTYTKRNKRNNFWLFIFSILLSAAMLLLPSNVTSCLM